MAYSAIRLFDELHFSPVQITFLPERSYPKQKKLQFANVILTTKDLDFLYKAGGTSHLKIYPEQFEKTDYVAYSAETINSPVVAVVLNPSPPAKRPT